jgi:hypothetical protein
MRCLTVGLGIIVFFSSLSAFAEETNQKDYGISYGGSTGLAIRKSLNENTLVFAGLGLGYDHYDNSSCCNANGNNYSITLGVRRLLSIDKLSKFIDVELSASYYETKISDGTNPHSKGASVYAAYGIEYFLSSNVSIEGKAGFSVDYFESSNTGGSSSTKSIRFPRAATGITYYW